MNELYTEIEIDASAERVWHVLTDFASFPQWNPFIPRAAGEIKEGSRIEAYLQPPGGMGMTIKPRLIKVEPGSELRWLGHLLISGLFDGEHIFTLEALGPNRVRFVQREEFRGMLVPLMLRLIGKNTQRGFEEMNQALKARAENKDYGT